MLAARDLFQDADRTKGPTRTKEKKKEVKNREKVILHNNKRVTKIVKAGGLAPQGGIGGAGLRWVDPGEIQVAQGGVLLEDVLPWCRCHGPIDRKTKIVRKKKKKWGV